MNDHEINYRVVKTKKNLKDALVALLAKGDFDHINVSMICAKANVTRATFYKYYDDKYVLAEDALNDLVSNVTQIYVDLIELDNLTNEEKSKLFIKNIVKYAVVAKKVILSINQNEGNSLISYIISHKLRLYLTSVIKTYKKQANFPYPSNLAASVIEGALSSLIIEWLNRPSGVTANQLVNIIYGLLDKAFDKDIIFESPGKDQ